MLLVCVVAFIKHQQVNLLHLNKAMNQQIIELLSHHHQHITTFHLCLPRLEINVKPSLFGSAVVPSDGKHSIPINRISLLFHQVLSWDDKDSFLVLFVEQHFPLMGIPFLILQKVLTVYLLLVNLIICQRSQFFSLSLSSFFTHLGFIQTFFFNIIVKEGSEKHDCNVCFASACFQVNYISILLAIRSAFLFPVVLYFLVNLHLIRERDQRSIS